MIKDIIEGITNDFAQLNELDKVLGERAEKVIKVAALDSLGLSARAISEYTTIPASRVSRIQRHLKEMPAVEAYVMTYLRSGNKPKQELFIDAIREIGQMYYSKREKRGGNDAGTVVDSSQKSS